MMVSVYGKIHHFPWENSLFLWSFSVAILDYQRVTCYGWQTPLLYPSLSTWYCFLILFMFTLLHQASTSKDIPRWGYPRHETRNPWDLDGFRCDVYALALAALDPYMNLNMYIYIYTTLTWINRRYNRQSSTVVLSRIIIITCKYPKLFTIPVRSSMRSLKYPWI